MLLQLSHFFPLFPLHPACPLLPIVDPHTIHCPRPWVIHINSLTNPFTFFQSVPTSSSLLTAVNLFHVKLSYMFANQLSSQESSCPFCVAQVKANIVHAFLKVTKNWMGLTLLSSSCIRHHCSEKAGRMSFFLRNGSIVSILLGSMSYEIGRHLLPIQGHEEQRDGSPSKQTNSPP